MRINFPLFVACILSAHVYGQMPSGAVPVAVVKKDSLYALQRGGKPYFVKGAGGSLYAGRIAAYGGNSIRTWSSRDGQKVLDTARKYGLTVLMGLDVARERHGFNYNDTAAVHAQLEKLRGEVMKYKDDPALLAWGIGNELNLDYKNQKVWDAVNDISRMVHSLDPHHPTCTVLAGISKDLADQLKTRCTDLDLLGVNTYGGLSTLPRSIRASGWTGPYLVTEWGPTGHWEGPQTAWNSSIEETSSEKAFVYKSRYEAGIEGDRRSCLGSYVFLWGQKQERTPTWYGLFTEKGEETEVMDVMQYLWSGKWPANKAPHLYSLQLDGHKAAGDLYLHPGTAVHALAVASDPDQDPLTYRWEVLPEPIRLSQGGDHEDRPQPVEHLLTRVQGGEIDLQTPEKEGPYRLFVYISDGHNNVATANIPFYVKKQP